jgi:hypothetical protein
METASALQSCTAVARKRKDQAAAGGPPLAAKQAFASLPTNYWQSSSAQAADAASGQLQN